MSLLSLGQLLRERRAGRHLREVAAEIGVSAATLSRIESGRLPDLETFSKICGYLAIDPSKVLGLPAREPADRASESAGTNVAVHFKTERTFDPELASDLATLILAAQQHLERTRS